MSKDVYDHIFSHLDNLLKRDFLIEIFGIPERTQAEERDGHMTVTTPGSMYKGKLVSDGTGFLKSVETATAKIYNPDTSITYLVTLKETGIKETERLATQRDVIILPKGTLANQGDGDLKTLLGNMVMNYVCLCVPFGDAIPYVNTTWTPGKIQDLIANAIVERKITPDQFRIYSENIFFIGHITELSTPTYSPKSLTINPKILERKKQLIEQHKAALEKNDAVVMAQIEAELIAMDKEDLKDDPSMGFLGKAPGKSFDIHRKKLFIASGMAEEFGDKGSYKFMANSLEEGWTKEDFHIRAGEIRKGSYERAKETAKGGEESKFLMRVFQNTRITEDDCGTDRTINVTLTKDNIDFFKDRTIIRNGEKIILSSSVLPSYLGKTVALRTPMYCASKDGYCYTCMGELFRTLDQEALTMSFVEIGSSFLLASLKGIHGQAFHTYEIKDLNQFIV